MLAAVIPAIALMLAACALQPASRAVTAAEVTFDNALHDCRMKQPGRVNRRLNLPPTSPGVAACLRQNGWETDGART